MFVANPFAELSQLVSPSVMQWYVVAMILLVAGGTLFDIVHKGSATYFFDNWRKAQRKGSRQIAGGELMSVAMRTAVEDVLASGEFCNPQRRVAHLLTMYGFLLYVVTTVIMVFCYPTPAQRNAGRPAVPVDAGRAHGLRRRLLVLVLHPRRCLPPRAIRRSA